MRILISLALLMLTGCAITVQAPKEELRFFHDENRGNDRIVCWKTNDVGWQCNRTDLNWPKEWSRASKTINPKNSK